MQHPSMHGEYTHVPEEMEREFKAFMQKYRNRLRDLQSEMESELEKICEGRVLKPRAVVSPSANIYVDSWIDQGPALVLGELYCSCGARGTPGQPKPI